VTSWKGGVPYEKHRKGYGGGSNLSQQGGGKIERLAEKGDSEVPLRERSGPDSSH